MEQDTLDYHVEENPEVHYGKHHTEDHSAFKTKRSRFRSVIEMIRNHKVFFIVLALALVVLGAYGGYRIGAAINASKPQASGLEARNERISTVDAVCEQIQAQSTLVCASQQYDLFQKVESSNRDLLNLFDLPFTKNRYFMRYVGTIRAGVDLKTAKFTSTDINKSGKPKSIVVELDAPKLTNEPDMDKTEIFDVENNIFNPIDPESVTDLEKTCIEQSNKNAEGSGLIDQAKAFAQKDIQTMLRGALGSKVKVTINWRS